MLTVESSFDLFKSWYVELMEGEERDKKITRWLALSFIIFSVAGSIFAFFMIFNTDLYRPIDILPPVSVSEERSKVENSMEIYRTMIDTRKDSQRIANDIVRIGRNPMIKMESPKEIPLISPEPSVADLVDLPPLMIVRAVMVIGKEGSAVVDIDGLGYGIVVKKGMSFLNGKGRFMSINAKEVVFRWNGKKVSVPVDL